MNLHVLEAYRKDGKRLRALCNKPLKAIYAKLPKSALPELKSAPYCFCPQTYVKL